MADPAAGRAGAGGRSPRLGAKDPRYYTNAHAQVGDQDLEPGNLESVDGRTRFTGFDSIAPLPANPTLAQVAATLNAMLAGAKGQA